MASYETKGTDLMNRLLLSQYHNSPLLKQYIGAFVSEMDELFYEIYKVEYGRYLSTAEGTQLDVIGIILQQSRNLVLDNSWFGFQGATAVDKMSDESLPAEGGLFISEDQGSQRVTPLNDDVYRRVLQLRAFTLTQEYWSSENVYKAIEILMGRVPSSIELFEVSPRNIQLKLLSAEVTTEESALIITLRDWFLPMGTIFNISLV